MQIDLETYPFLKDSHVVKIVSEKVYKDLLKFINKFEINAEKLKWNIENTAIRNYLNKKFLDEVCIYCLLRDKGIEYKINRTNYIKTNNIWWIYERKIFLIKYFVQKYKKFPNRDDLKKTFKFNSEIPLRKIAPQMGFMDPLVATNFKSKEERINYLKKELPPIVKNLGHLPKRNELRAIKRYDIVTNAKNIGGLINAYKILNLKNTDSHLYISYNGNYVKSSYEAIFDNFLYINSIEYQNEDRIDKDAENFYRYDFKISGENLKDHYIEIWGWDQHDNKSFETKYELRKKEKLKFYDDIGANLISISGDLFRNKSINLIYDSLVEICIENGIKSKNFVELNDELSLKILFYGLLDLENLKKEILPIVEKFQRIPTRNELKEMNREDLIKKLNILGGIKILSEIMEEPASKNYIRWSKERLLREMKPFIKDNKMPKSKKLKEKNRWDIIVQLRNYPNFFEASLDLNLEYDKRPKNYFTKNENVLRELKPHVIKLGRMYKDPELRNGAFRFSTMVLRFIRSIGGMDSFESINKKTFNEWGIDSVKSHRNKYVPPTKKVFDINSEKTYSSVREAERSTGINLHVIRDHCNRPHRFKNVRFKYLE